MKHFVCILLFTYLLYYSYNLSLCAYEFDKKPTFWWFCMTYIVKMFWYFVILLNLSIVFITLRSILWLYSKKRLFVNEFYENLLGIEKWINFFLVQNVENLWNEIVLQQKLLVNFLESKYSIGMLLHFSKLSMSSLWFHQLHRYLVKNRYHLKLCTFTINRVVRYKKKT